MNEVSRYRVRWGARLLILVPSLACAQTPLDTPTEGLLEESLFGEDFGRTTNLHIDGILQTGLIRNDTTPGGQRSPGLTNLPIAQTSDEGLEFNGIDVFFHRDIGGNIVPRVASTAALPADQYSFGFTAETLYGRSAQNARTFGFDDSLGINHPGDQNPDDARKSRQNFLAFPNVFMQAALPWYRGAAITMGEFGLNLGYEIPPQIKAGPDFFYSRTYAFIATPQQATGGLFSFNLAATPSGRLVGEVGIVNGWQNWRDNNNQKSLVAALRWVSSNMESNANLTFMSGDEQNDPGAQVQFPLSKVISPHGQNRSFIDVNGGTHLGPWEIGGELLAGRQRGDGQIDTLLIGPTPSSGFSGASYTGANAQASYELTESLHLGARVEWFRDPQGFALYPATSGRGDFAAVSLGLHYDINKFVRLRPEARYDVQTHRHGTPYAFGEGTHCRQAMGAIDVLVYF